MGTRKKGRFSVTGAFSLSFLLISPWKEELLPGKAVIFKVLPL
jgi:hypothetical protein